MFIDPHTYPFTAMLAANWKTIRDEHANIPSGGYKAWPEKFLYDHGWDVFGFYAFGRRLDKNCALCPETAHLIEQIPGMVTAGFSALEPGTHIRPHKGYTTQVLRCHLGLVVPAEGCALRVASETRPWREGECLVFDDTVEHEAWNRSDMRRVVLLLDFTREGVTYKPVATREAVELYPDAGAPR
jgi:aspartyl/asparaginyl beta-hydroxylase (cupin superfamily)